MRSPTPGEVAYVIGGRRGGRSRRLDRGRELIEVLVVERGLAVEALQVVDQGVLAGSLAPAQ